MYKVHQLMKDFGVIRRLEAKSSLNRRWVIKAKKVRSDSSNLVFVIVSGHSLGWKAQPGDRNNTSVTSNTNSVCRYKVLCPFTNLYYKISHIDRSKREVYQHKIRIPGNPFSYCLLVMHNSFFQVKNFSLVPKYEGQNQVTKCVFLETLDLS